MLSHIIHSPAVCLGMLVLLCGGALCSPLRMSPPPGTDAQLCAEPARSLLLRLKMVLDAALQEQSGTDSLFHGFNCTELPIEVVPDSQTPALCQPNQGVTCSDQSSSSFSEPECLENIKGDLQYYQSTLRAYMKSLDQNLKPQSIAHLNSITNSIQTLQEKCTLLLPKTEKMPTASWIEGDTYYDRENLCKQMKGFHIRAITINRALGYISSGEYKK